MAEMMQTIWELGTRVATHTKFTSTPEDENRDEVV